MEQRTCNIIMACKGHCELPGGKDAGYREAVVAYMSHECACPVDHYSDTLVESILTEALYDYFATADKPAFELRLLLETYYATQPTLSDRIARVFSGAHVMSDGHPVNGFTQEILDQSAIDLGEKPGLATGVPDDRPVGDGFCGGCIGFPGVTDDRCGNCVRNPANAGSENLLDAYAPAPGPLCKGCASNAKEGGGGAGCLSCIRCPASRRRAGMKDLFDKKEA